MNRIGDYLKKNNLKGSDFLKEFVESITLKTPRGENTFDVV